MESKEMEKVGVIDGTDPRQKLLNLATELTKTSQLYPSVLELMRDSLKLFYGEGSIIIISVARNNGDNRWKNWLPDMEALEENHPSVDNGYFTACQTRRLLKVNQQTLQYLVKRNYLDFIIKKNGIMIDQDSAFQVAVIKDGLVKRFKNKYYSQRLFNRLAAIKRAKKKESQCGGSNES